MAGYAKMWTTMYNDSWFVSLSCAQRGFFLQLIVLAKMWGDTGVITVKSCHALSQNVGLDGKTTRKFLGDFLSRGTLTLLSDGPKILSIKITNYEYWQGLRLEKGGKIPKETPPPISENSAPTKPNQTKPEQTKEDSPAYAARLFWMSEYQDKIGRVYLFKKLDGIHITAIVKAVGLEEFKKMVTWLFTTSDPWHSTHRTPGNLLKNINDVPVLMWKEDPSYVSATEEKRREQAKVKRQPIAQTNFTPDEQEGGLVPVSQIFNIAFRGAEPPKGVTNE